MEFEIIHKKYFRRLVYFADKILNDSEQAKDIVSESLIKLWQRFENFDDEKSLKRFMYLTVRNDCFNYLKHEKRLCDKQNGFNYVSDKLEMDVTYHMMKSELLAEITKEIDQLPQAEASVFRLFYFEDIDTNAIAVKLGVSVQTVRNQKAKAVNTLRYNFLKSKQQCH